MKPASERTRVRRHPERARYDADFVHSILDEAPICHLGFVFEGAPYVVPTIHARSGNTLYIHGSPASRMLRTLGDGIEVCITATLLDGLVFARSAFHHSMNYRSVMVMGAARAVTDETELMRAYQAIVEHVAPGRWAETRAPDPKEARTTAIVAIEITEASTKARTGPPLDNSNDLASGTWAGVLPLRLAASEPVASPDLEPGIAVPASVRERARR